MELYVIKPAHQEKYFKTVSVFVLLVNSNKMENALICQPVNLASHGMEKLALLFHVVQVLHSLHHAVAVKLQFLHALQDHIGMDIDVFI